MKKILVILGHADSGSLNGQLAQSYVDGATSAGAEVRFIKLGELKFDPILHRGYNEIQELEPDLVMAKEAIEWCEHLVIFAPTWWGSVPAIMKGFLDRVFVPGWAFKKTGLFTWDKLLKGRSARFVTTSGAIPITLLLFTLDPIGHMMKNGTLWYVGFGPIRVTKFGMADKPGKERVSKWKEKCFRLGKKGK